MVKVAHYTIGYHNPPKGGVEVAISDIAKMTLGTHEHVVVCKNGRNNSLTSNLRTVRSTRGGYAKHHLHYSKFFREGFLPNATSEFDKTTIDTIRGIKPDVLIIYAGDCNSMFIPLIELHTEMKILLRFQIYMEHNIDYDILNLSDGIILFDQRNAKRFIDGGDLNIPIHVMSKAFDDSIFHTNNRQPFTGKSFLYTGRFNKVKRLPELIFAFDNLICKYGDRFSLTLIGEATPKSYKKVIDEAIAKSHARIKVIGWKNHTELATYYRTHDFFIIPSRYETFCSSALEALACGMQLVINNRTMFWADGMCINGVDSVPQKGAIFESNPDGISAAIEKCMSGDFCYKSFADSVAKKYSYSSCKDKWRSILN